MTIRRNQRERRQWTRGPGRFRFYRALELPVAFFGMLATAPIVIAAALWVRLTSAGPGLFRQIRLGRHGEPFEIVKIRTMTVDRTDVAEGTSTVTVAGDARVTSQGLRLRDWKVDELPQLVNVFRGDMSFVGPRPDVRGFADLLEGTDRQVLDVRPGITGPATLLLRNETELLASFDDPEQTNRYLLFPAKTELNLAWIEHGSLLDDLRLVLYTLRSEADVELREMISGWDPGLLEQGALGKVIDHLDRMIEGDHPPNEVADLF